MEDRPPNGIFEACYCSDVRRKGSGTVHQTSSIRREDVEDRPPNGIFGSMLLILTHGFGVEGYLPELSTVNGF